MKILLDILLGFLIEVHQGFRAEQKRKNINLKNLPIK